LEEEIVKEETILNNKGYSLLEAIVIIAILGVLTGFMATSSGLFDGRRVKACADSVSSLLDKVRLANLGKDEVTLTIYKDTDQAIKAKIVTKIVSRNDSITEKTFIEDVSDDNVEMSYSTDISGSAENPAGAAGMVFNFNRNTGAIKDTSPNGIQCIILRKGNAEKKIKIYAATGKIIVE
jgi:hypothetical protein